MVSNENIFQSFERHISLPHSISLFYGLIKSPIAANFTFFSKFYNFPFLKSSTKVNRRRDGHATISWWSVGRSAVWPNLANFASLSKFYKPLAIVCEFIVCGRRRKTSELLELLFYFLYSTWKYCVVPTLAIFNYVRKIFIFLHEPCTWAVGVFKWSACSPSTQTIRVRIPLKSAVLFWNCLKRSKTNRKRPRMAYLKTKCCTYNLGIWSHCRTVGRLVAWFCCKKSESKKFLRGREWRVHLTT